MSIGSASPLPAVRADVRVAEFAIEYVVWDPTCRLVHHLDGWHAVVFDACRSGAGRATLLADLAAAGIGGSVAAAAGDVGTAAGSAAGNDAQFDADQVGALDDAIDTALAHLRGLSLFADGGGRPP